MRTLRTARTRGLSILEIVVSMAILAFMVLILMTATMPMTRASAETTAHQDMDRLASRVLAEIRRELRQSGWDQSGGDHVTSPADGATANTLTFQARTGFGVGDWNPDTVTIDRVADGTFTGVSGPPLPRYRIVRRQGGLDVDMGHAGELTFRRPGGGSTVIVTLRLVRNDPYWTGAGAPPALSREYVDQVQLLNPRP